MMCCAFFVSRFVHQVPKQRRPSARSPLSEPASTRPDSNCRFKNVIRCSGSTHGLERFKRSDSALCRLSPSTSIGNQPSGTTDGQLAAPLLTLRQVRQTDRRSAGHPVFSSMATRASVTCVQCGSPVPDGRSRCPRCSSTAAITKAALAESRAGRTYWVLGVPALLLGGVALAFSSGSGTSVSSTVRAKSLTSARVTISPQREPSSRKNQPQDITSADHSQSGIATLNTGDFASAEMKLEASVEADGQNAEALKR